MLYRVGQYDLDLRKFEVRKDGRVLPAEPQVLALLFLLVENRDRLVSKDELVATVWGGRAVSDSAISSRIKSARQLLGDNGEAQRLIRTIHGKGYRFVGEVSAHGNGAGAAMADRCGAKPSIAVLPFDCDDPELSVISDGVPHDLIVGLSRLHSLTVIARGSSFRFRGWSLKLALVRETLGVAYCLRGTVHRLGSKIAIAVELIDTCTGAIIWGELYEGDLDNLQEVREAIMAQVVCTLELQISCHEAEQARSRPPQDLDAWSCYHLGLQHMFRFNRTDNDKGLEYLERAAALDPRSSHAHAGISFARFQNAFMRYSGNVEQEMRLSKKAAELAVELDEHNPAANLMLGRSLWLKGEVENSVPWVERAITLSPNYAQAIYSRAWTDMVLSQGESGQRNARTAIRLSPIDPLRYAMIAIDGFTETMLGDKPTGAALVDRAAREPRAHVMIAVMAAICQVWAGDDERTRYWKNEAKARGPHVNGDVFLASFPFRDGPLRKRVTEALEIAGI
jgi:TolB-like protein